MGLGASEESFMYGGSNTTQSKLSSLYGSFVQSTPVFRSSREPRIALPAPFPEYAKPPRDVGDLRAFWDVELQDFREQIGVATDVADTTM